MECLRNLQKQPKLPTPWLQAAGLQNRERKTLVLGQLVGGGLLWYFKK